MVFGGIQKLTLLDYPDRTACTLFTIGCNFACPFCQNASLIRPTGKELTFGASEILDFLKTRQGLLDGVCISGGEPLIHKDLGAFIDKVKALGFLVKLDTNGSYPQRLKELAESGRLDYVAMDIKNTPEKYPQTIGLPEYDVSPIEESIIFLCSGAIPYEFRTTVVRSYHTQDDLLAMARWISSADKYFLQGFIDSGEILQGGLTAYSKTEMQQLLDSVKKELPVTELRGV